MGYMDQVNVAVRGHQDSSDALVTYKLVVLKQNITENRNRLTQQLIDQYGRNTKFVIKWNYVLDEDIVMPGNCIVEIDGGSISNEDGKEFTITGDDTVLIYYIDYDKALPNVELSGTWNKREAPRADEEDLTVVNNKIQLKDKAYAPNDHSGLGRVYLRKNLVDVSVPFDGFLEEPVTTDMMILPTSTPDKVYWGIVSGSDTEGFIGAYLRDGVYKYSTGWINVMSPYAAWRAVLPTKPVYVYDNQHYAYDTNELVPTDNYIKNVLTQSMINQPNTIYHIQYDYDLNGQSITVPEGCVLQFEGGSLSNGTIVGQTTEIAGIPKITATTSGTWSGIFTDIKDIDNRLKASGSTRPTEGLYAGYQFFDTALGRPIYWNGTKWVEEDGATAGVRRSGSRVETPAAADIYIGFKYFATDLYRNIYWDGTRWADDGGFTAGYHKGTIPPVYEELNGFLDLGYCYYVMNATTHTVTPIYAADFDDVERTVKWVTADGNVWQPNE